VSPDVVWESWNIDLVERERRNGHRAGVVWFTGLSGSGKSSIARKLERRLFEAGVHTMLLDGDQVRHGINGDLGFSPEDRTENIRRVGELASLFFRQGCVVLCTFVSPFKADRERARGLVPEGRFAEVFVDTPLEECERRDVKGLYARARKGEIAHMTGISSPYETPEKPEVHLKTVGREPDEVVSELLARLRELGLSQ
jgi:bifunctional enzyme CysN/CysC